MLLAKKIKTKGGKILYKKQCISTMRHSGLKGRRGQDKEEVDQDCARPRLKKWIDGSRVKDQEKVDQDPRSSHYTDAQVGDAEGLFKSLRIIILQPQVNPSICVSL